jgi:hypothetical protein
MTPAPTASAVWQPTDTHLERSPCSCSCPCPWLWPWPCPWSWLCAAPPAELCLLSPALDSCARGPWLKGRGGWEDSSLQAGRQAGAETNTTWSDARIQETTVTKTSKTVTSKMAC